jgi:uncharacterized membrane protein YqiK
VTWASRWNALVTYDQQVVEAYDREHAKAEAEHLAAEADAEAERNRAAGHGFASSTFGGSDVDITY